MDRDFEEPNSGPRGLPRISKTTQTQTQASMPQPSDTKLSASKNMSSVKSPPPSASSKGAPSISSKPPHTKPGQQPVDRVMVLQQRTGTLRLASSFTTPNNNTLYNRQLDFTPSLLSHPPAEYVLDTTFWKIEARDAARKADAIRAKQTTANEPKVPSVLLVTSNQPNQPNQQPVRVREKGHKENDGSQKTPRPPYTGVFRWPQRTTEEKRSCPSKLGTTTIEPGVTVEAAFGKASCLYGPQPHEPPTQIATSSDHGIPLGGVEVAGAFRVIDTGVHESEKWGGGRLIPSGLKVARRKNEDPGLNTTKLFSHRVSDDPPAPTADVPENAASNGPQLETCTPALPRTGVPTTTLLLPPKSTNVQSVATKSLAKWGASRRGRLPGATRQWKGYVLADDCPQTSKGKLLLLDAPPALLPQGSTRSGKVFKPPDSGSSSNQASEDDDSEEEVRVNRRRRQRGAPRRHILSSECSDE